MHWCLKQKIRHELALTRKKLMPSAVTAYSDQFRNFVDFATKSGGDEKSIALLKGTSRLGEFSIKANTNDKIGKIFRDDSIKDTNNAVRTLFKNTIVNMFGGENNIPKTVLDAMKLNDYGKGKPLSARRIMAVKTAIDKEARFFKSADAATAALNKGWTQAELPKIARATSFLVQATGVDEFEAINQLSTPGSKANRLLNYGGRFLESAGNFANGLRLIDSFATWFKDICDTMTPIHNQSRDEADYSNANTFTKLNISRKITNPELVKGFEKFAFEELSINPKANLSETNMEKLFGFKNNKAMNFIGRNGGDSFYSTISNIPKEKRAVIYTALTVFAKPANNAQEAHDNNIGGGYKPWIDNAHSPTFIARILKNFDKAESMYKEGTLTAQNIINEFFSEIPDKGDYDYDTINNYFDNIVKELARDEDDGGQYCDVSDAAPLAMENSGCTFDETVTALRNGQPLPVPQYLTTGTIPFDKMDGTTIGGRKLIEGDLYRPDFFYRFGRGNKNPNLLNVNNCKGFGFNFPNQEKFYTNGTQEGRANIKIVGDTIIKMCGQAHVNQANNVMMLSQSGLACLRGGLPQVNATSNEHVPVDFTISKNDTNGDITIKYTSPEALPFKFEWTATVDVNGNATTTPLIVAMKNADQQQGGINA